MNEQDERGAFEEWASTQFAHLFPNLGRSGDGYENKYAHAAWRAWQSGGRLRDLSGDTPAAWARTTDHGIVSLHPTYHDANATGTDLQGAFTLRPLYFKTSQPEPPLSEPNAPASGGPTKDDGGFPSLKDRNVEVLASLIYALNPYKGRDYAFGFARIFYAP